MKFFKSAAALLTAALLVMPAVTARAAKVTINKVIYSCNTSNHRASVQGCGDDYTIKKVEIPDEILYKGENYKVTSIASNAFNGCTELTSVIMGNYIETVGSSAFADTGVKTVKFSERLQIIGNAAFYNTELTSVTLPESLEIIRANAFKANHKLKTVTFGRNITEIGDYAFWWCEALTGANLPNSLKTLGVEAFKDCESLKSISLSTALTAIPQSAFENCPVENIVIPASVKTIGEAAFCNHHTPSLTIPGTVTTIGKFAFTLGTNHTLVLGEGITTIGEAAFEECTSLTSVTLPRSAVNVGPRTFARCYGLRSVTLAPTLTTIPASMFNLSGLTSITIPEGVQTIGTDAFNGCYYITTATFPSSLRTIQARAFSYCDDLATINFAEGLTTIGEEAFGSYEELDLTLPATVTSIGAKAFYGAINIRSVKALGAVPASMGTNVFSTATYDEAPLTVPENSVEAYRSAAEWSRFRSINDGTLSIMDAALGQPDAHDAYFDLNGRKVTHPAPGQIYIKTTSGTPSLIRK